MFISDLWFKKTLLLCFKIFSYTLIEDNILHFQNLFNASISNDNNFLFSFGKPLFIDIKWQYQTPLSKESCIGKVVTRCVEEVAMLVYGDSHVLAKLGWAATRGCMQDCYHNKIQQCTIQPQSTPPGRWNAIVSNISGSIFISSFLKVNNDQSQ